MSFPTRGRTDGAGGDDPRREEPQPQGDRPSTFPSGGSWSWTGLSGSGKSSLAFDTLHAEGQRRYVESFSASTRQFLERPRSARGRPDRGAPAVDRGWATSRPALPRAARWGPSPARTTPSALLYARLGVVHCLRCGAEVRPSDPSAVASAIDAFPEGTRYLIAFPLDLSPESDLAALADSLREEGFTRVRVDGAVHPIADGPIPETREASIQVVVDRQVRGSVGEARRSDSIEAAFARGLGRCLVVRDDSTLAFQRGWACSRCGLPAAAPEPRLFRYTSPLGACPTCEGTGSVLDVDLAKVVPDPRKTLRDGAVIPWTTPAHAHWTERLVRDAGRDRDRPGPTVRRASRRAGGEDRGRVPRLPRPPGVLPPVGEEDLQALGPGLPEPLAGLLDLPGVRGETAPAPRPWPCASAGATSPRSPR